MYSQILTFIIALLIFSIQQPGSKELRSLTETVSLASGSFAVYVLICRAAFRRIQLTLGHGPSQSTLALRYHRTQNTLLVLALGALAIHVYVFNVKFFLQKLPVVSQSVTLLEILGLAIFILHLCVIWFYGHPVYQRIHQSSITRLTFIRGNLAFGGAILIPWLLISLVSDVVHSLKSDTVFHTETGQLLLSGTLLLIFVFLAPPLVVTLWGCKSLEESPVRQELETFCRSHGFRVADFKLWPLFGGEMLTAGILGILPRLRYILVTRGLLSILDIGELQAVMAHEMGHVRRYHMILYLLIFLTFMVLTLSFNDDFFLILLGQFGVVKWLLTPGPTTMTVLSAVYSLPFVLLLIVYFRYIFGFFMRNSERQADLFALQLMGEPGTLISSLRKIAFYSGRIEDLPSWHHFSIRQRIDFLRHCHDDSSLIAKHNRKLYGAVALFFIAAASLYWAGSNLNTTESYRRWGLETRMALVEHQLGQDPENPLLTAEYGGILFELGQTGQAEAALKKALQLAPEDPTLLNNLAWLHATSPAPYFDPQRALVLAVRAAELNPAPHILDTLA
ncbi:MAG: M48 family metalloprotease, partial [Syntrophobacteraceae bacterium]|nr:M48 family metalloprotease [Syntrophobacteraceae bacterium]